MNHSSENLTQYTAIYRCPDDIANLKITVRACLDDENSERWDRKTFGWQEKRFSKLEREFYRDERNCVTDLEKKYHLDVAKAPEDDAKVDIYTYTNDDDFTLQQNELSADNLEVELDEEAQEFDYKNSLIRAMENKCRIGDLGQAMFIMADFGEYVGTTWIKDERVLCSVQFDENLKILKIFPDFTKSNPYIITINNSTSTIFKYHLENASAQISEEDEFKESQLIRKVTNHKLALKKQLLDTTFPAPPKNKLQIHLFFEILWGKQFEYSTIFVQYFVDLGGDWTCEDPTCLQGLTQTCYTRSDDNLAHFGHVFEITLNYNIEKLNKDIPRCPYIYFEVISRDWWGRYRTEGLTYKNLPVAKPGNYQYELQCFRLMPDGVAGPLRRFFLGDCSNYDDITWVGLPQDFQGPILNKYGTNTVGTGQLGLRISVLQHSQAFLERYGGDSTENRELFEKLHASSLVKSVEQVLRAFKAARKNMMEARMKKYQ